LKSRTIFSPSSEYLCYSTFYNKKVLDTVQRLQFPGFAVGASADQISEFVLKEKAKYNDPVFLTFDNSNHDSH